MEQQVEQTNLRSAQGEPQKIETTSRNPYEQSSSLTKLQERKKQGQPLRVAFFDIDSTITGDREKINLIRKQLEDKGFIVVFITSRTEEMIMSKEAQEKSPSLKRPLAQLGKDEQGKRFAVNPKDIEPEGVIDADIIAGSTGSRILIKQNDGGYALDIGFETKMKAESEVWRNAAMKTIEKINSEKQLGQPIGIEFAENFVKGETDVFPPNFRIQINFPDQNSTKEFSERLKQLKMTEKLKLLSEGMDASTVENILNLKMTDDSKPPERYSAYLTPIKGYKTRAVEEIVKNLCQDLGVERGKLELLIAGDSFPDLGMGLYGGLDTDATFLVAAKSRLTQALINDSISEFSTEKLTSIKKRLIDQAEGVYSFKPPLFKERKVVIGDEVFPGTSAQDSVLAFLNKLH